MQKRIYIAMCFGFIFSIAASDTASFNQASSLYQHLVSLTHNGTYPANWQSLRFDAIIRKLSSQSNAYGGQSNVYGKRFFIQWCNAIKDRLDTDYILGNTGDSHDLVYLLDTLQRALNNRVNLRNEFDQYYCPSTTFLYDIQRAIAYRCHDFKSGQLVRILDHLLSILPRGFSIYPWCINDWQVAYRLRLNCDPDIWNINIARGIKLLADTGHIAQRALLDAWYQRACGTISTWNERELTTALQAFAKWSEPVDQQFLRAWLQRFSDILHGCSKNNCVRGMITLAQIPKVRTDLHELLDWSNNWFNRTYEQMHQFRAFDLASCVNACAMLEQQPPEWWVNAWAQRVRDTLPQTSLYQVAMMIHASGTLRFADLYNTQTTLHALVQKANALASSFKLQDLVQALHGMCLLHALSEDTDILNTSRELLSYVNLNALLQLSDKNISQALWITRYLDQSMHAQLQQLIDQHGIQLEQDSGGSILEGKVSSIFELLYRARCILERPSRELYISALQSSVDFAYPSTHRVIEVDGGSHFFSNTHRRHAKDFLRDALLRQEGWTVCRIAPHENAGYAHIEASLREALELDDSGQLFHR